jgi:hypothetical protein
VNMTGPRSSVNHDIFDIITGNSCQDQAEPFQTMSDASVPPEVLMDVFSQEERTIEVLSQEVTDSLMFDQQQGDLTAEALPDEEAETLPETQSEMVRTFLALRDEYPEEDENFPDKLARKVEASDGRVVHLWNLNVSDITEVKAYCAHYTWADETSEYASYLSSLITFDVSRTSLFEALSLGLYDVRRIPKTVKSQTVRYKCWSWLMNNITKQNLKLKGNNKESSMLYCVKEFVIRCRFSSPHSPKDDQFNLLYQGANCELSRDTVTLAWLQRKFDNIECEQDVKLEDAMAPLLLIAFNNVYKAKVEMLNAAKTQFYEFQMPSQNDTFAIVRSNGGSYSVGFRLGMGTLSSAE